MNDRALPEFGQPWRVLEQRLTEYQHGELPQEGGVFERYWPVYPGSTYLAARSAQAMFAHTNLFSINALPSLHRIEHELRAMIGEILAVPDEGAVTITSGGTESNFLAIKAARRRGRDRGISRPNLVIPATAHPSFDKAGDELDVEIRRTAVDSDYRAVACAAAAAVDSDTILIAGSAPSYPQGVVDPIEALAEVARGADIWMHVDACVGGFLLPFLRQLDDTVPAFALDVPGVWSVSADLHKFGLCLNGISSLSLRDATLQRFHTYTQPDVGWCYRSYTRIGFTGSRPGSTLAAAWTTLRTLGRSGYLDAAASIRATSEAIARGADKIDGVCVPIAPEAGIVVLFPEDGTDVEAVSAAMLSRGWDVSTAQTPQTLHLLMSADIEHLVDRFLADLALAVADTRAGVVHTGQEFVYGD